MKIFSKLYPDSKILYLNDRHEEADTHKEDRRKLYDKRLLPLLAENDFAIFGEIINPFLWDYYRSLDFAKIKNDNIFFVNSYLDFASLTTAVLADKSLMDKLNKEKFDLLCPYIESSNTEILADKIDTTLLRSSSSTDWINNKANYRQVLAELNLPVITGWQIEKKDALPRLMELKSKGFKKVVLKKERSVSGFGVFVVETEKELLQCVKENFIDKKSFIIEGFIEDIQCSPNYQYFITQEKIEFLGATDQIFYGNGVAYNGNIYPSTLSVKIASEIEKAAEKICRYLQSEKCFGLAGIDFIVTESDKIYSTEVNARINGSTFPILIGKDLFQGGENYCWTFKTFNFQPSSFEKLYNEFKYFIKKRGEYGIFPIGVDLAENFGEGQFMIVAENYNKLYDLNDKFNRYCSK